MKNYLPLSLPYLPFFRLGTLLKLWPLYVITELEALHLRGLVSLISTFFRHFVFLTFSRNCPSLSICIRIIWLCMISSGLSILSLIFLCSSWALQLSHMQTLPYVNLLHIIINMETLLWNFSCFIELILHLKYLGFYLMYFKVTDWPNILWQTRLCVNNNFNEMQIHCRSTNTESGRAIFL